MTQFINLQPSAVKIRALAAKGLPIFGVTSTHQPRRPRAARDAQEQWGGRGGYFSSGERCACQSPPLPGFPTASPQWGHRDGGMAEDAWGRVGGPGVKGEKGCGRDVMRGAGWGL